MQQVLPGLKINPRHPQQLPDGPVLLPRALCKVPIQIHIFLIELPPYLRKIVVFKNEIQCMYHTYWKQLEQKQYSWEINLPDQFYLQNTWKENCKMASILAPDVWRQARNRKRKKQQIQKVIDSSANLLIVFD